MITATVTLPNDETAAAKFLSCVAYPGVGDAEKKRRDRWVEAALVLPFKAHGKHPPPWLQGQKNERIDEVYYRGLRRLQHRRLPAVWIFHKIAMPRPQGGLTHVEAYREIARQVPASYGLSDEYAVGKYWRESIPALAMAFPVWWLASHFGRVDEFPHPRLDWWQLIYLNILDIPWVGWATAIANVFAPVISEVVLPKRLLIPKLACEVSVPILKSPVLLPRSAAEIVSLIETKGQLPGPSKWPS